MAQTCNDSTNAQTRQAPEEEVLEQGSEWSTEEEYDDPKDKRRRRADHKKMRNKSPIANKSVKTVT